MTDQTDAPDQPLAEPHDIWVAFSLLSRLPVPVDHARAGKRGAAAAWAYPVVGLVLGALAGGMAAVAARAGVPAGMAGALALAVLAATTGGMHEDGLADFADAMGGNDRDRRLEIMKDSHIGAFGAIALTLGLLARWSGIAALSGWEQVAGLAVVGAVSRAGMVVAMVALPHARAGGLSAATGRPQQHTVLAGLAVGLVAAVLFAGLSGVWLFAAGLAGVVPVLWLAHRTLGGQTGDVLGAAQQLAEIFGLAVLVTLA